MLRWTADGDSPMQIAVAWAGGKVQRRDTQILWWGRAPRAGRRITAPQLFSHAAAHRYSRIREVKTLPGNRQRTAVATNAMAFNWERYVDKDIYDRIVVRLGSSGCSANPSTQVPFRFPPCYFLWCSGLYPVSSYVPALCI